MAVVHWNRGEHLNALVQVPQQDDRSRGIRVNEPVLFSSGDFHVTPGHVLSAAALWSILDPYRGVLVRRIARVEAARVQGAEVDSEALQQASEQFRRARGLRTAQATSAWMEAWGVSLEAFTEFLEQTLIYRDLESGDRTAGTLDTALTAEELWSAAVFGGEGEAWCHRLAARLAAAQERGRLSDLPASLFDPASVPGLTPDALRRWIDMLDLPTHWYDQLIELEAAHARFSESVLTPERLDAVMRARWSTLFTMDFEMGSFHSEAAAREACLCVTEDGVAIEEICAMAGGSFRQGRVMLGDVPDGVRTRALSATAGTLLPVFAWDNKYMVCRVRDKSEPNLDDATIREAVGRVVLDDALRPLIQRHIQWSPGVSR